MQDLKEWGQEARILKEKVKRMLTIEFAGKSLEEKLNIIDSIQRLGVSYHFIGEIEEALKQMNDYYESYCYDGENNLQTTSLMFRLLREQGYNVSSDIFNKLKDGNGVLKEALRMDIDGMLSLYEATWLRVHGEIILDEAFAFSRTNLESMVSTLDTSTSKKVSSALTRPIRKTLTRLGASEYFSFYQENKLHNQTLLKFAKLDFNIQQKQHQKELSMITAWWKQLEVNKKLPFARDRIVEGYFWTVGVFSEPEYVIARRFFTKVIAMTSIVDDIYDNYGVAKELEIFTDAVERWEMSAINELPEYMKISYQALLGAYDEMEKEMAKEGRAYAVSYAKNAMIRLVKGYYEETKWLNTSIIPTMEEYMKVALVTAAYPMLSTASFVGMGDIATKDAFEWLLSEPQIIKAAAVICRLMDDMASHEFEQERGHIPSAIQCYMNQYGVTKRETCAKFNLEVVDAWKDINKALLKPQAIPVPLLMRVLNLCRVIDMLYTDEDCYTNAATKLKQYVTHLLVNPVQV